MKRAIPQKVRPSITLASRDVVSLRVWWVHGTKKKASSHTRAWTTSRTSSEMCGPGTSEARASQLTATRRHVCEYHSRTEAVNSQPHNATGAPLGSSTSRCSSPIEATGHENEASSRATSLGHRLQMSATAQSPAISLTPRLRPGSDLVASR